MKICKAGTAIVLLILVLTFPAVADDYVKFNYQGRVKVQGQPFDGTGHFKFAIVNNAGSTTLWSNDGTSVDGGEPSSYIPVSVTEGIFNVIVGDPITGMDPINAVVFNHPSQIKLRIWFNDGEHGFQQLHPDRKLLNIQLMAIRSGDEDFVIYVNGTTGDDENSGLSPEEPKKTIQAAVDTLPERLFCNVTIDVADGVYREEVKIFGIDVLPGKLLTLIGDESWTPTTSTLHAVRISGSDSDVSPSRDRSKGIYARSCTGLVIQGFAFDYCEYAGVALYNGHYTVKNCYAENSHNGFIMTTNSYGGYTECEGSNNDQFGIYCGTNSTCGYTDCVATGNGVAGIGLNNLCSSSFYGTGNFSNNEKGIHCVHQSKIFFKYGYSGTISNNTEYGVDLRYDSYVEQLDANTFAGNGISKLNLQHGASSYNP